MLNCIYIISDAYSSLFYSCCLISYCRYDLIALSV
uniref:Uncharacterized protein n=1 Tax=Arundo donax TaxID=35708 RepID=A0A0A9F639_ARUDO